MPIALLIALFAPVAGLAAMLTVGGRLGARGGWVALAAPIAAFGALAQLAVGWEAGAQLNVAVSWIPTLGLELRFLVDGLSLLFGLIVSGMGVLVVFYACFYLDDHYEAHGRFYSYLLLFMGAMLLTVFSGDLLLLFIGWELTGISSFLLIGFLHGKEASRAGARMALLVTGATGLVMLAGVVVLGLAAGTYELAVLRTGALAEVDSGTLTLAFALIAVGAMGKSAQFPFHFWLPNAMAAPTPVSAYLHSATMVKLGVFLVARIFPLFAGLELWTPLLAGIGFGTMLLAALLALGSHDLKAVLAYSTVMQLGFLIGWYGLGGAGGVEHDYLHILSHVFYKGSLFMVVGIVDHATGERDLRKLGGLGRHMPGLAVIALVVTASMAGLPGTLGFISKEYALKGFYKVAETGMVWPLALMVVASILKVTFSVRLWTGVFRGRENPAIMAHFHAPSVGLQAAPAVLAVAALVCGLFPGLLGHGIEQLAVTGLNANADWHYSLWHGVTKELMTSAVIVVLGAGLYYAVGRERWGRAGIPAWLRFDVAFERGVELLPRMAKTLTVALRAQRPFDYPGVVLAFFLVVVGGYAWSARDAWRDVDFTGGEGIVELRVLVVILIAVATGIVIRARRWTAQLIALSIVGFLLTFYFVLLRAPDLAMTQILVETATLILVLLLLARFPRSAEEAIERAKPWKPRKTFNIVIAAGMGVLTTVLCLLAQLPRSFDAAGDFYLANTVPLAKGTNAVNTILVDFRGFDTLMEVTVLLIATLGALGLFVRYRRTPEELRAGPMGPAGIGPGRAKAKARQQGGENT